LSPEPDARTDTAEDGKPPEQGSPSASESNLSLLSFFREKKPAEKDPNNGSDIVSKNLKDRSKNSKKTKAAGSSRKEKMARMAS
jgi:hypothetical protein